MNIAKLLIILGCFLVVVTGCTSTSALGLAKADHVDTIYEEQTKMANSIEELQLLRSDNLEAVQDLLSEIDEISTGNALIFEANQQTNERMTGIEEQLEFLPRATLKELVIILASYLDLEITEIQPDVEIDSTSVEEPPAETETPAG